MTFNSFQPHFVSKLRSRGAYFWAEVNMTFSHNETLNEKIERGFTEYDLYEPMCSSFYCEKKVLVGLLHGKWF